MSEKKRMKPKKRVEDLKKNVNREEEQGKYAEKEKINKRASLAYGT